jgi:hypothetical protein
MFKKGVSAARRDFHEERLPDKLAKSLVVCKLT